VTTDDAATFQRASREFHEALLAPCRMPRLLHMLDIAWNLTEPVQTMMRVTGEDREAMRKDHEEMLAAFVARDADRLKAVSEVHHQRLTACITSLSDSLS
jgi:DNA-binding GntR family transcriptional regulator